MSTHPISSPAGDTGDILRWQRLEEVRRLCGIYLREPENVTDDGTILSLVFTPDLTGPQTATLDRLIAITGLLRITPTEWAGIEGDLANLRTYFGLASPTAAQTTGAVKAIIKTLRALIRD